MKKHLIHFSIGLALFVSSCREKNDDPKPASNNSGNDIISTASRQAKDDIVSWTQSDGAKVVTSLSCVLTSNDEPFVTARMSSSQHKSPGKIYKKKAAAFRKVFLPSGSTTFRMAAGSDNFDFTANAGTYQFVRADSSWNHTSTPSNKIVINFPSDTTSNSNDASLTINSYSEIRHIEDPGTLDADTSYLPTSIDAELSIGATKYVDVVFTATYNAEGIPTSMNYTLYLKPFTNTFSYTDGGSTVNINTSLAKDGENTDIVSSAGTVTFYDNTKDSVISVSGYTQYRRLKLSGNINIAAIENEENTLGSASLATLNYNANIDVIDNSNAQKIGHIEFFDNGTDTDLQVRFTSDNSTKLASEYFDPILSELETFLTDIDQN